MITALGVIGLIVACVGLAIAGRSLLAVPGERAQIGRRAGPPVPPPLVPSALPPYTGDLAAANGLLRPARERVLASVVDPSLSADRRVMLDRLLGEFGKLILPGRADAVTSATHLPAGPDGLGVWGTTVVRVPAGVVWVDDTQASFRRTADGGIWQVQHDRATDPTGRISRSAVSVVETLAVVAHLLGLAAVAAAQATAPSADDPDVCASVLRRLWRDVPAGMPRNQAMLELAAVAGSYQGLRP